MATAHVNGIDIEYESTGEGAPLLLIMGLSEQLVGWPDDWVSRFVDAGFRVIRFDNRDIGLSTKFTDTVVTRWQLVKAVLAPKRAMAPYLLGDMAEDAAALLDHLEIDRAHVVGVSMGGMITQSLAIRHPNKVASLTSIMSTTGDRKNGKPKMSLLPKLLKLQPRKADAWVDSRAKVFELISGPHYDEAEVREIATRALARNFDETGPGRQTLAIMASPDRTADLREVSAPALVIHGLVDPLVRPTGGVATAKAIPGSRLLTFPDMGHDLPRQRWDEIVAAIVDNARRGGFDG